MKNIVWLASYPKSGNTWFRMFLSNYLFDKKQPARLKEIANTSISSSPTDFEDETGLNPFELYPDEVDLYRPDIYCNLSRNNTDRTELLMKKTHDAYILNRDGIPIFPKQVSLAAVYFIRNPLDVCVSYSNHETRNIEKIIEFILDENFYLSGKRSGQLRQILKSWTSHVQSWISQNEIPVHVVRYEDLLKDSVAVFTAIVKFLGMDYDEENLIKSSKNCDFGILRKMEEENGFVERMQNCNNFFWKGEAGYFREFLNEDQIRRIVDYNSDTMLQFGYIDKNGNLTI